MIQRAVQLTGGRRVFLHDTGPSSATELVVFWHHGTPQTGEPPPPLVDHPGSAGIRWIGLDRAGYGDIPALVGRDIASAATDVRAVADELGIARFAVMGHSGGGPHALACAALLPDRVLAAVSLSGLAPYGAPGLDWFGGMADAGSTELKAATRGRPEIARFAAETPFDPELFTAADHSMFGGPWGWLGESSARATAGGLDGLVDDDIAYVTPWGFDPAAITVPVLLMHGTDDRVVPASHSQWLGRSCRSSELRTKADDGHISVLAHSGEAIDWLSAKSNRR